MRLRSGAHELENVRGEIEFRGVSVEYPTGLALDGVALRIPAGKTIAVVGHTGIGQEHAGEFDSAIDGSEFGRRVLLDGVDVRELSPEFLRRQIGFVPQETFLVQRNDCGEYCVWGG